MASKPVDNSVNERRLRPIYDWLDNGNNKKALQEAEKVLKKQPSLQCAKVLKALALIRLGKSEEAQSTLQEVLSEEPYDDSTLQAMAICYRETHRPELTCQAYESALKKDPTNEEFLSHLFMGYVRIGDYRKQQQTAMALYKVKPKNPYYFWAVMSILMQAYTNDEKVCLTITLPLAERLIKKFVDENKVEAEAEVQLYLLVLEKQKKFKEALDILEGPLGEKLSFITVETKMGEYLQQLKMWDRMLEFYQGLLQQNPDQWINYVRYAEALFEATAQNESALSNAKQFIFDLVKKESESASNKLRGPYLARIYLWQQLHDHKLDASTLFGDLRGFIKEYVEVFGDKPCSFQDLKPFLNSLPVEHVSELLKYAKDLVTLEPGNSPSNVKQICRHMLHLQLSRSLGEHDALSRDEKIELSNQLWVHFLNTKFLNEGLLSTDFRPNDGYALLSAHLLLDAWNNDPQLLDRCLILLETALENSPANYHLKLLTTRVYMLAGHGSAAVQRYETLDIKYIQLDSLGHLLTRPLISMGLPISALPLLSSTLRFYTTHARETSECLISAYKFGSFGKIPEFTQFCQRLDSSAHFAAVTTERMLLEILVDCNSHVQLVATADGMFADPTKDQPDWNACVDNRDLGIFTSWAPPSKQVDSNMTEKTFSGEVQFARLRNRLVHSIIAAVSLSPGWHAAHASSNGNAEHNTALDRMLNELRTLLGEISSEKESFINFSQFAIQSPPPPRLYTYVQDRCLEPLLMMMQYLSEFHAGTVESKDTTQYQEAVSRVIRSAQESANCQGFWRNYVRLERIYNAVETLSFCALMMSIIHAIVKVSFNLGKKKKKRDGKNDQSDTMLEKYSNLLKCTTSSMRSMNAFFEVLNVEFAICHLKTESTESETIFNVIKNKLSAAPATEMRSMLADKLKLLEACVL